MSTSPTIDRFMTKAPITIQSAQSMTAAHRLMNDHGIRHLPVLEGGKLVGIVSQRDLHLLETLKDVDPKEAQVSEAMSTETYAVGPRTSLKKVAAEMAEHKYGAAVIMEKEEVVGVFTTIDALRALAEILDHPANR